MTQKFSTWEDELKYYKKQSFELREYDDGFVLTNITTGITYSYELQNGVEIVKRMIEDLGLQCTIKET